MAHIVPEIPTSDWIACPECDLVQREPEKMHRHTVVCIRCSATLYRSAPHAREATLAVMAAAAVFFVLANTLPLMSLELQGRTITETLPGMMLELHHAGMTSVGLLAGFTLILMPAVEIGAYVYLLGSLELAVVPPGFGRVARLLNAARPWSMIEVFMLAALVSIAKLEEAADLVLEPGFWCMGAVMLLVSIADTVFDQRDLWDRAASVQRRLAGARAS